MDIKTNFSKINRQKVLMIAVLCFAFAFTATAAFATLTFSSTAITTDSSLSLSGGNVGIGTTSPTKTLDVAGSANLSTGNAYYINGTSVLNGTTLGSGIVNSSLTSVGTLTDLTVTNPISGSITGNAGTVTNGVYTNVANSFTLINPLTTIAESWIGPSSTTGIYFKGGNVGIGTTGPGNLLTVNGTIAKTTVAKPSAGFGWISTDWTTDDVMLIGYNINPLTTLNDLTEPAVMLGLESNFNDGTDDIMEMYVQAVNISGTSARPWFATYKRSNSTIKQFDVKADTIRLGDTFYNSLVTLTPGNFHASGAYRFQTSPSGDYNITLDPGGAGVVDMVSPVSILTSLVVGGSASTVPTEMLQIGVPTSGAATKGLLINSGFATYGNARLLQRTSGGGLFLSNNINANLLLDDTARTGHAIYMGYGSGGIGFDLYSAGVGARTAVRAMFIKDTGTIGIGTTSPNANAILDVASTTKAFMPPRMTTAQRDAIASPTAGMVIYNSTTNKLNVYTTVWEAVTSAP